MSLSVQVPSAAPYAWPYDGGVSVCSLALVIAGHSPEWAARSSVPATFTANLGSLADAARAAGVAVVSLAQDLPASTRERLSPAPSSSVPFEVADTTTVQAPGLDAFRSSALDDLLRDSQFTHLLVCGYGLEGPVHSTLRSANDRGYECLLVADACAPLVEELHAPSIHTVTMSGGIFGAVGDTVSVLDALGRGSP